MSTPAPLPPPARYGAYLADEPLPSGLAMLRRDASLRTGRQIGVPYVPVVGSLGHIVVGYAVWRGDRGRVRRAIRKKEKERRTPKPHPDVLLCTREASRAAHAARDRAEAAYARGDQRRARAWRQKKQDWYALKERGIVHLHRAGVLRYAGVSPQGMAVYEYGNGGMQCLHSLLHPRGAERKPIEGHPEVLLVPAAKKARGISHERVRVTLGALPYVEGEYYRSKPPINRSKIFCFLCGEGGHIARECPYEDDDAY